MSKRYFSYVTLFLSVISVAIDMRAGDGQLVVKHSLDVNSELSMPNEFFAVEIVDGYVKRYNNIVHSSPEKLVYSRHEPLNKDEQSELGNIITDLNKVKLLNSSIYKYVINNEHAINCFVNYTGYYARNTIDLMRMSVMDGRTLLENRACTDFKIDLLKDYAFDKELRHDTPKNITKRFLKASHVFFGALALLPRTVIERSVMSLLMDQSKVEDMFLKLNNSGITPLFWTCFTAYFNHKVTNPIVNGILSEAYNAPQNITTYRKLKITENFLNQSKHIRDIFYGACSRYVVHSELYKQMIKDPLASEIVTSLGSIKFQRTNLNCPLGVNGDINVTLLTFQEEASQISCLYDHIIEFRCPDNFEFDFDRQHDETLKAFVDYISGELGQHAAVRIIGRNNMNPHTYRLYKDFLRVFENHSIIMEKKIQSI